MYLHTKLVRLSRTSCSAAVFSFIAAVMTIYHGTLWANLLVRFQSSAQFKLVFNCCLL